MGVPVKKHPVELHHFLEGLAGCISQVLSIVFLVAPILEWILAKIDLYHFLEGLPQSRSLCLPAPLHLDACPHF